MHSGTRPGGAPGRLFTRAASRQTSRPSAARLPGQAHRLRLLKRALARLELQRVCATLLSGAGLPAAVHIEQIGAHQQRSARGCDPQASHPPELSRRRQARDHGTRTGTAEAPCTSARREHRRTSRDSFQGRSTSCSMSNFCRNSFFISRSNRALRHIYQYLRRRHLKH